MKPFKHISTKSLEETVSVLREYKGKAKLVSGGTDVLGRMKDNILPGYPGVLVNITSLPGLNTVKEENGKVVIGALTTLDEIARSNIVREKLPALAEAARQTASPHIREMGTIGGNITQANRCWYYWVPDNRFDCMRKGGKNCYALTGDGRYHSIMGGTRVSSTPCSSGCPNNVAIPSYMSKIREGKMDEAARILMQNNPLPAITGRVCPHFCETDCNRREMDDAVSVRAVERYIGDYVLENSALMYVAPDKDLKKSIAVVGSGPSGLSAAYFLRRLGYGVTVYEAMEEAGGLLVYGIPPYRLPKDVVSRQVAALGQMGVTVKLNAKVGGENPIEGLMKSYDAVYVATGAWKERASTLEGAEHTVSGTRFLQSANRGLHATPGKRVAVIGGGNVAIDVARTLLRSGSEPVIVYRRGKAEMPALPDEVEKTEEEGIRIEFLTLPVRAEKKGDKIALTCRKMELGSIDASGRPRPVPVEDSDYTVEYDAVITATGEEADNSILPRDLVGETGKPSAGEKFSYFIGRNVFAGGDFVSGPSTVVAAIVAGRKAAVSINCFLKGPEAVTAAEDTISGCGSAAERFNSDYLVPKARNRVPELSVTARLSDPGVEEAGGLELDSVIDEAGRCLNCSCVAVNPSDTAPALIALNAVIVTTKRVVEAEQFFAVGIDTSTILDQDEIVKEIQIPLPAQGARSMFTKFALRKSIDFPVVNIAAYIESAQGIVKSARICLNSVYNVPLRVVHAEQAILGRVIDESVAEQAAEAGLAGALPLVNNQYKIQIARTLVKRAILVCADRD